MKDVAGAQIPETLDEQLGQQVASALWSATKSGVPAETLRVAARWWQLETYLRTLAYIELRADRGPDFENVFDERVQNRVAKARSHEYMASAVHCGWASRSPRSDVERAWTRTEFVAP